MLTPDPKRTGVPATRIKFTEPPMELVNDRWHGPPGAMLPVDSQGIGGFIGVVGYLICCPGCGQLGGPRDGASWAVTDGSRDDVTTLSLSPSIAKGCCGWHGYLRNGVFESC